MRDARSGRSLRPAGRILLLAAGVFCAAGAAILFAPLPLPAPNLELGSRPEGARFYDRSGRLLMEAGSGRAQESRWYGLENAPPEDCVLPAFLAARSLSPEEIRSRSLLDSPRAMMSPLLGTADLAEETAAELLAMNGRMGGVWEKARLAGALAARYSRMRMAEWIINVRLYGRGTVGVDSAALSYYDVHAGELSAGQCAALEALAEEPALGEDPAGWKDARNAILSRMLNAGLLQRAGWERAIAEQILPAEIGPGASGPGADSIFGGRLPILESFLQLAVDRLADRYPTQELPRTGIRVFTSLDLDFELQLLCAAQNLLAPAEDSSQTLPTLEGKPCDMAALLGPASESNLPADLALAVIEPASGDVLAYFDSARGEEAVDSGPAGTAFLPFVYLSAFTRGFSPASMLLDIPRAGLQENPDGEYLGPVSARTALQSRALAAAAGMTASVGGDHVARTLSLLDLTSGDAADLPLEDQLSQSVDLLSLTQAYAMLAGGGLETADLESGNAVVILRVEQGAGAALDEYARRQTRRIIGSDLAYLVQEILTDRSGRADLAAPALAGSRSAVAVMLAEDLKAEGAWAFAFTSGFAVGVRSRSYAMDRADPRAPWILAQAAAGWALRALPLQTWLEPPGIVRRDVCVPSGLLPSRFCPNVVSEIFLAGNEPLQVDTFYRPVAVNRESGRLATLWTPLSLVEEQVFFSLEGEARTWGERSGFPLPPDTYDTLPESFPYYDDLHISSPGALAIVRGKITLRGTASASGMERYLVQAGPGLYPSIWYTLGSGEGPVHEGNLAQWDTSGLQGLWSVQLTAVFPNGKILTVAIPLTLDNTPPVIRWIQPATLKQMSILEGEAVILQVEVTDNLKVGRVDFYLDGKLKTRLESGPFSVRWSGLAVGRHLVKVCASDRSGNETCTQEVEVVVG